MEEETELEVEKIRQKIDKIKRNRKKKQIQPSQVYNYKNIEIIPTIYDVVSSEKLLDTSSSISIPQAPDLKTLASPNYIPFNFVEEKEEEKIIDKKEKEREKENKEKEKENVFISMYHYLFPVQEGAQNKTPDPSGDFDINKVQFWNLSCNFLSMDFYTNIFSNLIEKTEVYKDTEQNNKKKDTAIIKSFFDQFLMIILAYIMTINVYYFTFMYKWDCRHWSYVPTYGVYFGETMNEILDFFLKDTRVPVYYCQYIYTYIYPSIFFLLEVRRYKRVCFIFIFIFMLCFVFITGKQIGLTAKSFVTNGKINPMVILLVLASVFYGVFFEEKSSEELIEGALQNVCTDNKAISTELIHFCNNENIEKVNGRPYYYSLKEKYDDFQKEIEKYNLKNNSTKNPPPNYITLLKAFVDKYKTTFADTTSTPAPTPTPAAAQPAVPVPGPTNPLEKQALKLMKTVDQIKLPIPPKKLKLLAVLSVAKGYTIISAIIRLIIAMITLPIAQIFVSWFFLYTTSGIGLLFEEGISNLSQTILCIKGHMNDNDGEDDTMGKESTFYKSVNDSPFFKFWINELLLTTMYSIYCFVKFLTVPTQISSNKINIKIIMAITISSICGLILSRGYLLHRRHCNMNREMCTFKGIKTVEKGEMSENGEETRYEKLGVRSNDDNADFEKRIKDVFSGNEISLTTFFNNNTFFENNAIIITNKDNQYIKLIIDLNNIYNTQNEMKYIQKMPTAVAEVVVTRGGGENKIDILQKLFLDNMDFELLVKDNIYIINKNNNRQYIGKIVENDTNLDILINENEGIEVGIIKNIKDLLQFYLTNIKPILSEYKIKNKNHKTGFFKNRTIPFNNVLKQGYNYLTKKLSENTTKKNDIINNNTNNNSFTGVVV